jgi:hypothetical protein
MRHPGRSPSGIEAVVAKGTIQFERDHPPPDHSGRLDQR